MSDETNKTNFPNYKVTVKYGDKELIECMKAVIRKLIIKYSIEKGE